MTDFTPTQGKYLSYIYAYTAGFGVPPAEAEIAEAIGVSAPSVHQMIKMLHSKGLIHREPGVSRSIRILVDGSTIPRWTGKPITRVVTERGLSKLQLSKVCLPNPVRTSAKNSKDLYVLKITLVDSKPPIWRRIETHDVSLAQSHELIQAVMGWSNSHLHQFCIGQEYYVDPQYIQHGMDDAISYKGITLSKLVAECGPKLTMRYDYDFGDDWQHKVVLEKITQPAADIFYPRCTGGARACPPEDVGGIWGFYSYLEAIDDPKHPEHAEKLEWNGPFDPESFDQYEATSAMYTAF